MGRFLMAGRGGLALAVVATGPHEGAFEGGGVASPFPLSFLPSAAGRLSQLEELFERLLLLALALRSGRIFA